MEAKRLPFSMVYWCAVAALYLAVSFAFGCWAVSWVVWVAAPAVYVPLLGLVAHRRRLGR